MIGQRLGSYEIVAKVGEGGMGEVYRATDSRLQREVAIKVLPPQLAANADALARFEREARAVAALSHPNILSIFDIGTEGGRTFAVMELLEGETLRERLAAGAFPLRKAIEIAAQVADGLAAAHDRGIVHRDLKPENLFLVRDGRVKILDFGLAKLNEEPGSQSALMGAATVNPGTQPGTVLGTVGYMAPEQVKGLPADARADLFALGVMLYEMLTGQRAFSRGSSVETLSAILKEEPPELEALAAKTPPSLDRVLRHCLEKNPEERFQSARDLAFALRDVVGGSSSSTSRAAVAGSSKGAKRLLPLAALAAIVLLGAGFLAGRRTAPATKAAVSLRPSFRQLTKLPGGERSPSMAPDGASFVFEREVEGQADLFLQRVDGQTAILLTADCKDDDREPAFSPDGTRIAFRSSCNGGGVFLMGATGENVRRVSDFGFSPAWSPDGRELAVVTERPEVPWNRPTRSELWAIGVDSGAKRLVSKIDSMNPSWSPSGKRIAVWGLPLNSFQRDLWTVAADGSEATYDQAAQLTDDPEFDWNPIWSADGKSVFFASARGGTFNFWNLPVDEATGKPLGDPEPVTAPTSWAGWMSASRDGRRIAFVDRNARTTIYRAAIDPARGVLTSVPEPVPSGSIEVYDAGLSPDGGSLVLASTDPPQQLFVMHADGSGFRQITDGPYRSRQAAWSPDGRSFVFQSNRFPGTLAFMNADGGGLRELLTERQSTAEPVFSSDGRRVAFGGTAGSFLLELAAAPGPGAMKEIPFPEKEALFAPASFSPDDRLLSGAVRRHGGADGIALYSIPDGRWTQIEVEVGTWPKLLDNDGRMVVDRDGEIVTLDGPKAAPRTLVRAAAGHNFRNISLSLDRRTISWIDETDESDIWLMTLGKPEEPAK